MFKRLWVVFKVVVLEDLGTWLPVVVILLMMGNGVSVSVVYCVAFGALLSVIGSCLSRARLPREGEKEC